MVWLTSSPSTWCAGTLAPPRRAGASSPAALTTARRPTQERERRATGLLLVLLSGRGSAPRARARRLAGSRVRGSRMALATQSEGRSGGLGGVPLVSVAVTRAPGTAGEQRGRHPNRHQPREAPSLRSPGCDSDSSVQWPAGGAARAARRSSPRAATAAPTAARGRGEQDRYEMTRGDHGWVLWRLMGVGGSAGACELGGAEPTGAEPVHRAVAAPDGEVEARLSAYRSRCMRRASPRRPCARRDCAARKRLPEVNGGAANPEGRARRCRARAQRPDARLAAAVNRGRSILNRWSDARSADRATAGRPAQSRQSRTIVSPVGRSGRRAPSRR